MTHLCAKRRSFSSPVKLPATRPIWPMHTRNDIIDHYVCRAPCGTMRHHVPPYESTIDSFKLVRLYPGVHYRNDDMWRRTLTPNAHPHNDGGVIPRHRRIPIPGVFRRCDDNIFPRQWWPTVTHASRASTKGRQFWIKMIFDHKWLILTVVKMGHFTAKPAKIAVWQVSGEYQN